jgi:hypothetical protein
MSKLKKYELINIANANAALNECRLFSYYILRNQLLLNSFIKEHQEICKFLSTQVAKKEITQAELVEKIDAWSIEEVEIELFRSTVKLTDLEGQKFDALALNLLANYTITIEQ